jgi:hypothetical protein
MYIIDVNELLLANFKIIFPSILFSKEKRTQFVVFFFIFILFESYGVTVISRHGEEIEYFTKIKKKINKNIFFLILIFLSINL